MNKREKEIVQDFADHVKYDNQHKHINEGDYCIDQKCKGKFVLQKDIYYKGVSFYECNICGWYTNEQIN